MGMVGYADGDGIDARSHLIQHLAPVFKSLGIGKSLVSRFVQSIGIDVANGDDISVGTTVTTVTAALATYANTGEVDSVVCRLITLAPGFVRHDERDSCKCGLFDKLTAAALQTHDSALSDYRRA